jgi:hypothetical protein
MTDIITLRFEAHDLTTTLRKRMRAAYFAGGRSPQHNRLARLTYRAQARHYRRSQMLDSAAVCLADAAKFPRERDTL